MRAVAAAGSTTAAETGAEVSNATGAGAAAAEASAKAAASPMGSEFSTCGEASNAAGASMGAHTAVRLALLHPGRVAALGLITPSFDPSHPRTPEAFAGWDALAQGLRQGGVEGFVRAYDIDAVPEAWRGRAFAIFVFHLLRLGPARRLAAGEVPADIVRAHLGQVVEAVGDGTPERAVG